MTQELTMDEIYDEHLYEYFNDIDFDSKKKTEVNIDDKCESCGANTFVDDMTLGFSVCNSCGHIREDIIDTTAEWRSYDDDNRGDVARCSIQTNKLLPQSSLSTSVPGYGLAATYHKWDAMPYRERSLNHVFKKIQDKCHREGIPKKVEDDSKIMYKLVSECKHTGGKNNGKFIITRGVNRESIIAASLFYACKRNRITRSPKEIANMFGLDETDLNKGAKNFIRLRRMCNVEFDVGTSETEHFVKRKCDQLGIHSEYTKEAIKISKNIDRLNLASNHTTYSLAAASIMLMAEVKKLKKITKTRLAEVFGVSDVTIGKTYKKISACRKILVDDSRVDDLMQEISKKDTSEISNDIMDRMDRFGISKEDIVEPEITDPVVTIVANRSTYLRNEFKNRLDKIREMTLSNMDTTIYNDIDDYLAITE